MAIVAGLYMNVPGCGITINYNEANNRITSVDWVIPDPRIVAKVQIYNNDVLVVERSESTSGSDNIPGVHTLVYEEDPDNPGQYHLSLPGYLTHRFEVLVPSELFL